MKNSSILIIKCTICGVILDFENCLFDDRYGYPGCFDLYKCSSCGHRIINIEFTPAQLTELYTDYYPRASYDVTKFKAAEGSRGFCAWLSGVGRSAYLWVPENVKVLDIGCGFGETLAYHKARGCDVYGVEVDENIRKVADMYVFNVHVGQFTPDQYEPEFFDYVTLDQVVEHVCAPIKTLQGVAKVLKPGGLAILSLPNSNGWGARLFGSRWINWHAPYHLHHFSEQSMRIAALNAGLCIDSVRTVTSSEWLHYQWNHMLMYPRMGEPSIFWSPKAKRSLRDKLVLGILSVIHRTKLNHLVTRLFDVLGIGDNYLFFLRKT